MIIRLSFIALLCLAITQWAGAQFTDVPQSARRDAHRQLNQAITAWQHNDLAAARRLVDAALATGVPDEQFAVSPKQLLKRIEQEEARLRRAAEAALQEEAAAKLAPPSRGPQTATNVLPNLAPTVAPYDLAEPDSLRVEPLFAANDDRSHHANAQAASAGTTPGNTGTTPIDPGFAPADAGTTPIDSGFAPANAGATLANMGATPANAGATLANVGTTPMGTGGGARASSDTIPTNAVVMGSQSLATVSRLPTVGDKKAGRSRSPLDWLSTTRRVEKANSSGRRVATPEIKTMDSRPSGDGALVAGTEPGRTGVMPTAPWKAAAEAPMVVQTPTPSPPSSARGHGNVIPHASVESVTGYPSDTMERLAQPQDNPSPYGDAPLRPDMNVAASPIPDSAFLPADGGIAMQPPTAPFDPARPHAPIHASTHISSRTSSRASSHAASHSMAQPAMHATGGPAPTPNQTAAQAAWSPAIPAVPVRHSPEQAADHFAPPLAGQDLSAGIAANVPSQPLGQAPPSAGGLPVSDVAMTQVPFTPIPPVASVGATETVSAPQMAPYGGGSPPAYPTSAPVDRRAFGRPGSVPSQQLVVGPATGLMRQGNWPTVMPNVQSRPVEGGGRHGNPTRFDLAGLVEGVGDVVTGQDIPLEVLPDAGGITGNEVIIAGEEPIFGSMLQEVAPPLIKPCSKLGRFLRLFYREPCPDRGVGYERLASAPMFIDIAQPLPNTFRIRLDAAHDVQAPDRAEFIYSSLAGAADTVNYQDVRMQLELGGAKFTTATEIPIRVLDPLNGGNTAGLGDMSITVKTVLVDGETWQITQMMRTRLNTGSITHNLSVGHVAMEPGVLFRMKWDDDTFWHGQLKYRFPIGGNPIHSGQVMQVGSAISKLWYETDQVALIPSLEAISYFVLDGQQFSPGGGTAPVDGEMILNLAPSLRFVVENGSDLGLLEFGLGSSMAITSTRWHSFLVAGELRITF